MLDLTDSSLYLNRELSWLKFNTRVLAQSLKKDLPLFERLKFLAIYATNLDEFYMIPVVYRTYADTYYSPMSYSSQLNDSVYSTQATSEWFDQSVSYNYLTGEMTIYSRENWGGIKETSPIDMREITMVLKNVWLAPSGSNSTGYLYGFSTKSTAETKNVVQSITYTRKFAEWNGSLSPPAHNPMTTYTYLRTNYPENSTQFNYIKFSLNFWGSQ